MTREGVMRLNCLKCDGPLTAMRAEPWGWVGFELTLHCPNCGKATLTLSANGFSSDAEIKQGRRKREVPLIWKDVA
jgi:hypothetical protein